MVRRAGAVHVSKPAIGPGARAAAGAATRSPWARGEYPVPIPMLANAYPPTMNAAVRCMLSPETTLLSTGDQVFSGSGYLTVLLSHYEVKHILIVFSPEVRLIEAEAHGGGGQRARVARVPGAAGHGREEAVHDVVEHVGLLQVGRVPGVREHDEARGGGGALEHHP